MSDRCPKAVKSGPSWAHTKLDIGWGLTSGCCLGLVGQPERRESDHGDPKDEWPDTDERTEDSRQKKKYVQKAKGKKGHRILK